MQNKKRKNKKAIHATKILAMILAITCVLQTAAPENVEAASIAKYDYSGGEGVYVVYRNFDDYTVKLDSYGGTSGWTDATQPVNCYFSFYTYYNFGLNTFKRKVIMSGAEAYSPSKSLQVGETAVFSLCDKIKTGELREMEGGTPVIIDNLVLDGGTGWDTVNYAKIKWTSSNKKVATITNRKVPNATGEYFGRAVNGYGECEVTAKKAGTTTITAEITSGKAKGKKYSYDLTVLNPASVDDIEVTEIPTEDLVYDSASGEYLPYTVLKITNNSNYMVCYSAELYYMDENDKALHSNNGRYIYEYIGAGESVYVNLQDPYWEDSKTVEEYAYWELDEVEVRRILDSYGILNGSIERDIDGTPEDKERNYSCAMKITLTDGKMTIKNTTTKLNDSSGSKLKISSATFEIDCINEEGKVASIYTKKIKNLKYGKKTSITVPKKLRETDYVYSVTSMYL